MEEKTLKALKESIEHWEKNSLAGTPGEVSTGSENCALCVVFLRNQDDPNDECRGCPIRERTGTYFCYRTPYYAADDALDEWHDALDLNAGAEVVDAAAAGFRTAAREMVDFLKGLLPEGEE